VATTPRWDACETYDDDNWQISTSSGSPDVYSPQYVSELSLIASQTLPRGKTGLADAKQTDYQAFANLAEYRHDLVHLSSNPTDQTPLLDTRRYQDQLDRQYTPLKAVDETSQGHCQLSNKSSQTSRKQVSYSTILV
jgi:hypothetical protein